MELRSDPLGGGRRPLSGTRFPGRTALVTGAPARLRNEGAQVASVDVHGPALEGALVLAGDVARSEDLTAAVEVLTIDEVAPLA